MYDIKLDWLAFTWKASDSFQDNEFDLFLEKFPEIADFYQNCEYIRVCSPMKFYECSLMFNENFMISWRISPLPGRTGDRNLGVNVSIPAHGLDYFFDLMGYRKDDIFSGIKDLSNRGVKFSRIDIAYDDYSKMITPDQYGNWYINRQLVTHFRKAHYIATSAQDHGTFYLGARSHGKMIRIYDKAFETRQKDGSSLIDSIRYEVEVHGEHTEPYIDYMLQHKAFPSLIATLACFIDRVATPGTASTRDDRVLDPLYEEFISSLTPPLTQSSENPVKVTRSCDNRDKLKTKISWFNKIVVPTCRSLITLIGYDAFMNACLNSRASNDFKILAGLFSNNPEVYNQAFEDGTALGRDFSTCW